MERRSLVLVLPAMWLALRSTVASGAELAVAHLRIDGMT